MRYRAKFIGKDGSMGFRHGKEYNVKVLRRYGYIYITTDVNLWCPYSNKRTLLKNWEIEGWPENED